MIQEEYQCKFIELDKYSMGVSENFHVGRFIGGLWDHVRYKVINFMLKTLSKVMEWTRLCGAKSQ
jgi:hypothetical protein